MKFVLNYNSKEIYIFCKCSVNIVPVLFVKATIIIIIGRNVYMDGVVREVNDRVLGKGLELLTANGGRFEINQLLFADDTALVADSEEKLCRLVSEFGRVCERRKLRANVGTSKVMRCSRSGNGDRMHVILNGEPSEEVDCFKYLRSQVAADGGSERDVVHRMNEGY